MHRFNILAAGALLAAATALAGCDTMNEMMGMGSNTKSLHATLSGGQEAYPNKSTGTGNADFTVDPSTKQLSWKVSYSGLTGDATAAHIHGPAAPGVNGPVVVNLAPNGVKNPLEGSTTLTDTQLTELLAGKYYVNIHTAQHKGGEIRGQITP
jgi:predicted small secreted protein